MEHIIICKCGTDYSSHKLALMVKNNCLLGGFGYEKESRHEKVISQNIFIFSDDKMLIKFFSTKLYFIQQIF